MFFLLNMPFSAVMILSGIFWFCYEIFSVLLFFDLLTDFYKSIIFTFSLMSSFSVFSNSFVWIGFRFWMGLSIFLTVLLNNCWNILSKLSFFQSSLGLTSLHLDIPHSNIWVCVFHFEISWLWAGVYLLLLAWIWQSHSSQAILSSLFDRRNLGHAMTEKILEQR